MLRFRVLFAALLAASFSMAAPPNRITRPLDSSRSALVPGRVHPSAQQKFDRGAVDPKKQLNYMVLLVKPSSTQQADLDRLILDQQNPSSPNFRSWLTPEQFSARFGLNSSDQSKIVAWLTAQGFSVDHLARSGNWIAFSGAAERVSTALHTSIHQFDVNGKTHFANTAVPSVPEAISDVVAGFLGLDDFRPHSNAKMAQPNYTSSGTHYMGPSDFATIYNVAPLYAAGIDGTGQSIAIVGESDILLSDITKFRTQFGLPANSPKLLLYGSTDPGFDADTQFEANLDLEWAGAIAPKATIYYVYGPNAFTAMVAAIEANLAPVVSASYGSCEIEASPLYYRAIAQQANAQGITLLASSGDAGAAGCDQQGIYPFATRGKSVDFPAVMPEVTGVGGTQFVEGTGTYWGSNSATLGSALSYIPEAAWNESDASGLLASGGGTSIFYPKPAWQTGPGVPEGNGRAVPDISFSAALHDGYLVTYSNTLYISGGTSASAPSMAAIVALLNQYQVSNKFQKVAGLGNINPQLYRLAQSAPTVFHDVVMGDTVINCGQGSPDCLTGSFGFPASPTYDLASGLGSIDANAFVSKWNTATNASLLTLSSSVSRATLNDTVQLTASVTAATGSGTPTGTVNFVYETLPLGSAPLIDGGSATVSVPLYKLGGTGSVAVQALYSGDAAFGPSSASKTIAITNPVGVTSIVPSAAGTVWPSAPDAQGLSWQSFVSLTETAGVPALITGLTIDGVEQDLSQSFPSTSIAPKTTVRGSFVFRNLAPPVTKTFVFTGTDPTGLVWTRQVAVNFFPLPAFENFNLTASPLTAVQNPASATCPWSVQINLDELGGYGSHLITNLYAGGLNLSANIASIFGTTRMDAYEGHQGTLCFSNITPPATDQIAVVWDSNFEIILNVSFAGPPANPGTLSASPANVVLGLPAVSDGVTSKPYITPLKVNLSDKTAQWTASIFPANRTTSWLTASQLSGTGPGTINLTVNSTGFEPGVYRASILIQSTNAVPQYINVPVIFQLGGSTAGTSITAVANAASYTTSVSPGMLLSVFGTNLAADTTTTKGSPLPYSSGGVTATVNGLAAPILYTSPTMLNIQVPYAVGSGPAVIGVNNNGEIASFSFNVAPAAPGIFADADGNVLPLPVVTQGSQVAFYVTGTGDVTPAIKTGYASTSTTAPVPVLPITAMVGGVPAFLEFVGTTPGMIGVTQVNILVPSSTPTGNQPLVVTVGGNASKPVNIVVQPAK